MNSSFILYLALQMYRVKERKKKLLLCFAETRGKHEHVAHGTRENGRFNNFI